MECSPELEELLEVVFNLSSREIDVLMALCGSDLSVEEISEELDRDRSTVQRYLSGLKKSGLVKVSKDGRKHIYSVDRDSLREEALKQLEIWSENKRDAIEQI